MLFMDDRQRLTIGMSGASGFVGTHLTAALQDQQMSVVKLDRGDFAGGAEVLARKLAGVDVIINLAGAPIIGRWSSSYKKIMYESRVLLTRAIVGACSRMTVRPSLLISTSAVGYYSSVGSHTEQEFVMADDFLGHLAADWEQEALGAAGLGMRVLIFRLGVVLGRDGGALNKMLLPFKAGFGGTIGDGSQPFSWVHIRDLEKAYLRAIDDSGLAGIYNLTAPEPTTNKGLTMALAETLGRPAFFRVPEFVLRMKFGEGAQVLTRGQRAIPKRLMQAGFTFQFENIGAAVKDCLS